MENRLARMSAMPFPGVPGLLGRFLRGDRPSGRL